MADTVQHFYAVQSEQPITRARVVTCSSADELALFMGDSVVGMLTVPKGKGSAICEQMGLVDKRHMTVSLATIQREFDRVMRG